jgi:hypothetical protein
MADSPKRYKVAPASSTITTPSVGTSSSYQSPADKLAADRRQRDQDSILANNRQLSDLKMDKLLNPAPVNRPDIAGAIAVRSNKIASVLNQAYGGTSPVLKMIMAMVKG